MPELPEVESVRRGLEEHLVGRRVVAVKVQCIKVLRSPTETPELFAENLLNRLIKSVHRRGKYLILSLEDGYSLAAHLKMRGQMRVASPVEFDSDRYLCVTLTLDDGREWRFYDMWAWGELRVFPGGIEQAGEFIESVANMGPEPLSQGFSPSTLILAGKTSSRRAVKCLLLDQSVVAGVGNIYADESLYRAMIHPARACSNLSELDWTNLYGRVVDVIADAVSKGGTVSDNFVDTRGMPGRYVPEVYGRAGKDCLRCGRKLQRTKVCGRGTVFCEHCQPMS